MGISGSGEWGGQWASEFTGLKNLKMVFSDPLHTTFYMILPEWG